MSDVLSAIVAAARKSALERERRASGTTTRVVAARTPGSLIASLRAPGVRVIAEAKRRSPSRGILRDDYDPAAIARAYEASGAAAVSVLTEPTFFDGSLDHLRAVRAAVSLPILRKDFVVTPFQIEEAAASGADAVLLIAAALGAPELTTLLAAARTGGLDALVEVHDRAELDRALESGAAIVGVNSRNLRTLDVDVRVFDALAPHLPDGVVAVAESGLKAGADVARLRSLRYDAFLIGERFMGSADPGAALAALLVSAGGAV
jgi:indole-3-glycerol phosphate synthase